jgi:diacylglycerol kinase (ATP)
VKGSSLLRRFGFALAGLREAVARELTFRIQLLAAVCAIAATLALRAPPIWLALVVAMIGLVLAAELFNTALERALDGLHPAQSEFVRIAKDCAAAAVLVLSAASVIVFGLMLWHTCSLSPCGRGLG